MKQIIPKVTLASNVNHSVYTADALSRVNLLTTYLGPVIFNPETRWSNLIASHMNERRTYGQVVGLPIRRLWGPELKYRLNGLGNANLEKRVQLHSKAVDTAVFRRLGNPDIFHANTCGMVRSFVAARSRGAIIVADHRDVHPREHEYSDPLAHRIEREFEIADWVIVNSEFAATTLLQRGVPESKLHVIPLGADLEIFSPGSAPVDGQDHSAVVLFVGSLTRRKGVDLLLEALSRPEFKGIQLRVCGPGRWSEGPAGGEGASVRFLGPLSRAQLVDEYRRATVSVLPSRTDAYGLVAVESIACGTPVIVTDRCGMADLVRTWGGGLVVPSGSVNALSQAINSVVKNDLIRKQLSQDCRQAALAASWETYGERLQKFYHEHVIPDFYRKKESPRDAK